MTISTNSSINDINSQVNTDTQISNQVQGDTNATLISNININSNNTGMGSFANTSIGNISTNTSGFNFSINSSSSNMSFNGSSNNFSFNITSNYSSIGQSNISQINANSSSVFLNVTNVTPPSELTLSNMVLDENAESGTVLGTLLGKDPDENAVLTYSLLDDAGGKFVVDAITGVVRVKADAILDFETAPNFNITATVTDQFGVGLNKIFSISLKNVNEAPSNLSIAGGIVTENSVAGTIVGTLVGADPDAGSILSYSLIDNAGGRFVVNSKTGVITVNRRAVLDYEKTASLNITARVTDQTGLSLDKIISINLTNVNEAPTNLLLSGNKVSENASAGTIIGSLSGVDPDGASVLTYSLIDDAGGRFVVDGATGALSVTAGAALDYEQTKNFNITARVTDQFGLNYTKIFGIGVTNVNEAPIDIKLTGGVINENSAAGTVVGTFAGIDPDAGGYLTYSLVDNAGGKFSVNARSGILYVNRGAVLDYEKGSSLNLTARVTDQGGLTYTKNFLVSLNNLNETPISLILSANRISENSAAGTVVGMLTGTDPDSGSVLSYSLVDDAGGRFAVDANTGQIRVNSGAVLDFEKTPNLNVKARVTDEGGLFYEKVFVIGLNNVNEAPTDIKLSNEYLADNAMGGSVLGVLTGVDPDARPYLTYSLIDSAGGKFIVNSKTGVISLNKTAVIDPLVTPIVNITARVTDQGGLTYDKEFVIKTSHIIFGTNGNDILTSTAASDIFTGGEGSDTFVFHLGCGKDTISDFAAPGSDHDIIQLDPDLVRDWSDLLTKSAQSGSDVVITSSSNDILTLKSVALSSLTEEDFVFKA